MTNTHQIGDRIILDGRTYIVHGFSPRSVTPPRLLLQDAATGARLDVPANRVTRPPSPPPDADADAD